MITTLINQLDAILLVATGKNKFASLWINCIRMRPSLTNRNLVCFHLPSPGLPVLYGSLRSINLGSGGIEKSHSCKWAKWIQWHALPHIQQSTQQWNKGHNPNLHGWDFSIPPSPKFEPIPLRPIVSSNGSVTYDLAKHLTKILSPFVGQSPHYVTNTQDFVNRIKDT